MPPARPRSRQPLPRDERGSAMLSALCFALVFIISLASYVSLTYASLTLSTRNIMGAHAAEVAEAALELALYTANSETSWPGWTVSTANNGTAAANFTMTASGLVLTSSNPTPLNFGNGSTAQVRVTVTQTSTSNPLFTATATMALPNALSVVRTVSAAGAIAPIFVNALATTTGTVNFKYAGGVDSFNSALGPYSAASAGFAGVVVSQDNATTATVSLNNAQISGYVSGFNTVSPTSTNWLSYAGNGKVIGASTSPATYIDSTRVITNPLPYQPQLPEVPEGSAVTPVAINLSSLSQTLGSPAATAPSYYDVAGDVYVGGTAQLIVQGPVVLYVHGNFYLNTMSGDHASIAFNNSVATYTPSLEVHMMGGTTGPTTGNVTLNGTMSGTIPLMSSGLAPLPKWMSFVGTNDANGTITIGTTTPLYGTFYFPTGAMILNNNNAIFGSLVAANITLNDSPQIHYDIALRTPDTLMCDAAFHAFQAPISLGSIAESAGP